MEKFKLNESNNLYLPEPANESMPWTSDVAHQEIVGQQAVMGTDGHGSIRNESTDSKNTDSISEDLDRAIKDMLDPRNVIDLKQKLDDKAAKIVDESKHSIDKTLDKDNHKATTNKQVKSALKKSLINDYTQIGVEKGETRVVPESVTNELSSMLNLSYRELEKRIKAQEEKNLVPNTSDAIPLPSPAPLPSPKLAPANTPWAAPDIRTRKMKSESELQIGNALLEKAYVEGDLETFNKMASELRHEVVATEMLTGVKGVEAFDKLIADKRANPYTNSQVENSTGEEADVDDINDGVEPVIVPVIDVLDYDHEQRDIGDLAEEDAIAPVEVNPESTKEKKKISKKVKVAAIGLLALVGISAAGIAAYKNLDDNSDNTDRTEVPVNSPEDVADIDFGSAQDAVSESEDTIEDSSGVSEADIAALDQSIKDRTVEVADTQGSTSWDKATVLYGDQASPRLIQAAEDVAADGIEVSWSSDPRTSNTAQLSINGTNDPSVVWQFLAPRLARKDAANFLENAAVSENAETALPATK